MNIRKAIPSDYNRIMEIYAIAREYMKNSGNPNQWKDSYPEKNIVNKDIEEKIGYVLEDNGHICACFVFLKGYEKSQELKFPSDKEYGIIHRVASDGSKRNIVSRIVDFAKKEISILRIETHEDNKTMQKAVEKLGFKRLGIIQLDDKSFRILYELKEEL